MITFLLLMLAQMPALFAQENPTLMIAVGDSTKIKARGELLLGPDRVVTARDLGSQYLIQGAKAGWTEFRNGPQSIGVSVLRARQMQTLQFLKGQTASSLGLRVEVQRDQVVLRGQPLSFSEWEDIARECATRECSYQTQFELSPDLRSSYEKMLSQHLHRAGFGLYRMSWEPRARAWVPTQLKNREALVQKLAQFGVEVENDEQAVEWAPSVRVQITILEMKKSAAMKLGVQWPGSYSAQLIPAAEQLDRLVLTAQFLEQKGWAKVLASPSLLCRSGKASEFLAGGEIPIKLLNYRTHDVVWKKYGILLRIQPKADFSGRMSLAVETEISSIDPAHTVDGIPGFFTNRVQSHFDLTEPRTIALSGLIKNEESEAREGLPGLSRIPILGTLFSSQDFRNNQTELVILVRPEVVSETEAR